MNIIKEIEVSGKVTYVIGNDSRLYVYENGTFKSSHSFDLVNNDVIDSDLLDDWNEEYRAVLIIEKE